MKRFIFFLVLLGSGFAFCDTQITNLKVTPISPFGKVILEFDVEGKEELCETPWVLVTCREVESGNGYHTMQVPTLTEGHRRLEWDMAKDGIHIDNKAVTFKVEYCPIYLVIDLSGGTTATRYPVTTLAAPPEGGWTDEYKTTKLVLRAIEAGSFKMSNRYDVTISKPFYMGVFEVTQKQYQLVTGSNPSQYTQRVDGTVFGDGGATHPVESVWWNEIRGDSNIYNGPSNRIVDANSFMGKIRAKTGLELDLPAEAQWEYACRAGTTSQYNNGGNTEADLRTLGRYNGNAFFILNGVTHNLVHASVGSYLPNAWGLYDMHGNVWERCLDWYGSLASSTDPVGPSSGENRVIRGGSWNYDAGACSSSYREAYEPSFTANYIGFRLACQTGQVTTSRVTVTFDANGGNGGVRLTQDYGSSFSAPTVDREYYTFVGWLPSVPKTIPTTDTTYVAQWRANQYTQTFDANGGKGGASVTLDYGSALSAPTVTRDGYTFIGWSPSLPETVPAMDATYIAQWQINQYTQTFDANGGEGGISITQDYGSRLSAPTVTRDGYTFVGWRPSFSGVVPAKDETYIALWRIDLYVQIFDANGGEGGMSVTLKSGSAFSAPIVTREGYTFVGWSPSVPDTVPTMDTTYVAQWRVNQYTQTFDANGGEGGTSVIQGYGSALSAPTVAREGYTFIGWTPSVPTVVPTMNATYVAQWRVNQYMQIFNGNGGYGGAAMILDYGSALSAPTMTREGYTFIGWTPSVPATVPATDTTYTAQWQINQYTQTFDANGGEGGISVTQNYGSRLSAPTVTREGYTFIGWSPSVPSTVPATDATYVAQWHINVDSINPTQSTYLVIDLSGGASAMSYPVTTLMTPPEGGWTDEYKTTKLVLRRIESGSFKMQGSYDVTLSKPFYMGVFEVTQKQYQLVMGSNPSKYIGDTRPVGSVAWYTIHGSTNWPSDKTVSSTSFMGKICAKTGLAFDLPTEAQWEYACRAGTTSQYNNGGDTEADLKTLGRYDINNGDGRGGYSEYTTVGSYLPNAWGLYDMHGNVWEWCLDRDGNLSSDIDPVDPVGPTSGGSYRVARGGSWTDDAGDCTSCYRLGFSQTISYPYIGIRLVWSVEP